MVKRIMDPKSQHEAGMVYLQAGNYARAFELFRQSAIAGYAPAQSSFGALYYTGKGVAVDFEKALYWFRLSAEQGYVGGQNNLGLMYMNGHGVPQDDAKAIYWLSLAAHCIEGGYKARQTLADICKPERMIKLANRVIEAELAQYMVSRTAMFKEELAICSLLK